MNKKVHIVPHMHWDREWYFTTEESRILLLNNMEEILTRLENDPDYKYYVLDGQTCILEDFFAIKPYEKERVKKLVQAGKLIIGPWYTQTDEIIVHGESIVRNMMYGIRDCREFGKYMDIGYLPDSFGQSEQMPQILNGFGIERSIFWRGTSERHGTNKTEFFWKGYGNSKVLVQLMPLGYAIGKYLPTDRAALKKRMDEYFGVLDPKATGENILVANGHDQMPIQQNIFEIMDILKEMYPDKDFFMSSYEDLFKELEKDTSIYDTISGEFLDGKYMRVHKSIYSTRMDIKNIHAKLEHKLVNILEPLASIAWTLGFEYYHGLFEKIWKELMKNHAHDSIGCCCSDEVHRQIMARFKLAEDMIDNLITFYKRKIVDAVPNRYGIDKIGVFNLLPYERTEIVTAKIRTKMKDFSIRDEKGELIPYSIVKQEIIDAGLIDRQLVHYENYDPFIEYTLEFEGKTLPSMGYRIYHITDEKYETVSVPEKSKNNVIENKNYKISINKNGTINILDKKSDKTYKDILLIEEGSDDGDEYNYSPVKNDWVIYSEEATAEFSVKHGVFSQEANISFEMPVPQNLKSRAEKIKDSVLHIETKIRLEKNSDIIKINMSIDNKAIDHRVRVLIPTEIASKFSYSDNQFGTICRPVEEETLAVWEKENWKEKPVSINPMLSFVDIHNEENGAAVLTNGLREYEIIGDNFDTIAITLFRSVGVIGKEDLVYRPGRPSGIKMETPDSQMIGKLDLDFGIIFHEKDYISADIPQKAKEYSSELSVYNKMPYNAMKLNPVSFTTPESYSVMNAERKAVISAVKKAEDQDRLVIRLFNPSYEKNISEKLSFNKEVKNAFFGDLNENLKDEISVKDNTVQIDEITPCEFKTIII